MNLNSNHLDIALRHLLRDDNLRDRPKRGVFVWFSAVLTRETAKTPLVLIPIQVDVVLECGVLKLGGEVLLRDVEVGRWRLPWIEKSLLVTCHHVLSAWHADVAATLMIVLLIQKITNWVPTGYGRLWILADCLILGNDCGTETLTLIVFSTCHQ